MVLSPVLRFRQPSQQELEDLLTQARAAAPSYPEVGATKSATLPADYRHDRYGVRVGDGSDMFERAIRALRRWQPQTGAGVAVVPRDAWALRMRPSCCFFEPRCFGRPRRAGSCTSLKKPTSSVSPTAPSRPPEKGEVAFTVSRDGVGAVDFRVASFSRIVDPLARLGTPITRWIQKRVTRRYLTALAEAAR